MNDTLKLFAYPDRVHIYEKSLPTDDYLKDKLELAIPPECECYWVTDINHKSVYVISGTPAQLYELIFNLSNTFDLTVI